MKMLLFFMLVSIHASTQEHYSSIDLGLRYNKLDFFIEPSFVFAKTKLIHEFGIGLGSNRTFGQNRLFPEVYYGLSKDLYEGNILALQAILSYHLSTYNSNKANQEFHFFNEVLFGSKLTYGKKVKSFIQPEIGVLGETFRSDYLSKVVQFSTFNYSLKVGVCYAL